MDNNSQEVIPGFQLATALPFGKPKDRLIVVESIYHQPASGDPTSFDSRFGVELASQEQPYERTTTVGEEWTQLSLGSWITECRMLVLRNEEGNDLRVTPSPEMKAALEAKVLELSDANGPSSVTWLIAPGTSMRGRPSDLSSLRIRSASGTIKFTVCLYPL